MHFGQLAADCKPDIIIGTETWLTKNHSKGEISIVDMYEIKRRDRGTGPHGVVLLPSRKI